MRRVGGLACRVASPTYETKGRCRPQEDPMPLTTVRTPHGTVDVDPAALVLGELLVSDDGVELEVTSLDPLRLEPAPMEEEDWGE